MGLERWMSDKFICPYYWTNAPIVHSNLVSCEISYVFLYIIDFLSINSGILSSVDKMPLEADLIERALAAARNHGLTARVTEREPRRNAEPRADAVIELGHGAERTRFLVEAKRTVTPATIGPITHHVARLGEEALLITHHVTPPLAEHLRRERIAFLDTAGNAFIDRPPLFVWVKGTKAAGGASARGDRPGAPAHRAASSVRAAVQSGGGQPAVPRNRPNGGHRAWHGRLVQTAELVTCARWGKTRCTGSCWRKTRIRCYPIGSRPTRGCRRLAP